MHRDPWFAFRRVPISFRCRICKSTSMRGLTRAITSQQPLDDLRRINASVSVLSPFASSKSDDRPIDTRRHWRFRLRAGCSRSTIARRSVRLNDPTRPNKGPLDDQLADLGVKIACLALVLPVPPLRGLGEHLRPTLDRLALPDADVVRMHLVLGDGLLKRSRPAVRRRVLHRQLPNPEGGPLKRMVIALVDEMLPGEARQQSSNVTRAARNPIRRARSFWPFRYWQRSSGPTWPRARIGRYEPSRLTATTSDAISATGCLSRPRSPAGRSPSTDRRARHGPSRRPDDGATSRARSTDRGTNPGITCLTVLKLHTWRQ